MGRPSSIEVVVGLLCSLAIGFSVAEQEAFTAVDDDDVTVIEEIIVMAKDRCGPWPIAHISIAECAYPELKRDQLHQFRVMRDRYLDTCLICSDSDCQPRPLAIGARRQNYTCKRLFQTPRRVPRTLPRVLDVDYLVTYFVYNINALGRAEDIQILRLDSDLAPDIVLELITKAAAKVRFEPIDHGGKRLPLTGVEDSYILEP